MNTIGNVSRPTFLIVPERSRKPRTVGVTHVLDKGASVAHTEAILASVAPFIDIWKFGWGTAYLDPALDRKLAQLRAAGVWSCLGGTLLEIAWLQGKETECLAWAHDVGITQMITASLGGPKNPTMDDVKKAADEYNKIAAAAAAAGMQQGLHNEGFEVSMVDGRRTYDVLIGLLDPKLVKFQFQMSTIRNGFVAADYFTKYPGRFFSMHLQDWNPETRTIVAVGKGSIDWKKTFAAAKTGGVKNYFVEQNMDMTKDGVAFLKTLDV